MKGNATIAATATAAVTIAGTRIPRRAAVTTPYCEGVATHRSGLVCRQTSGPVKFQYRRVPISFITVTSGRRLAWKLGLADFELAAFLVVLRGAPVMNRSS